MDSATSDLVRQRARNRCVPKSTRRDYFDQMTAEVREERQDSCEHIKMRCVQKRRENQYLDCELMLDVAAIITRPLKVTQEGGKGVR